MKVLANKNVFGKQRKFLVNKKSLWQTTSKQKVVCHSKPLFAKQKILWQTEILFAKQKSVWQTKKVFAKQKSVWQNDESLSHTKKGYVANRKVSMPQTGGDPEAGER